MSSINISTYTNMEVDATEQTKPRSLEQELQQKLDTVLQLQNDTEALLEKTTQLLAETPKENDYRFQVQYRTDWELEELKKRWNDFPNELQLDEELDDKLRELQVRLDNCIKEVQRRGAAWAHKEGSRRSIWGSLHHGGFLSWERGGGSSMLTRLENWEPMPQPVQQLQQLRLIDNSSSSLGAASDLPPSAGGTQ